MYNMYRIYYAALEAMAFLTIANQSNNTKKLQSPHSYYFVTYSIIHKLYFNFLKSASIVPLGNIFSSLGNIFYYLFTTVFGLCFWAGFSLVAESEGYSSCGALASHCSFSCCQAQALEHSGSSSCSTWTQQLWLLGSRARTVVVVHVLSCSVSCRIFPDQQTCLLHWQVYTLPLATRKVQKYILNKRFFFFFNTVAVDFK